MQSILDDIGTPEDQAFIRHTLQECSAISSLSGQEINMLYQVRDAYFLPKVGQSFIEVYRDGRLYYGLLLDRRNRCPYMFCVHLDRVPNFWTQKAYVTPISENSPGTLTGQLDDIAGIAVLRYLHMRYPLNILFTTNEEFCESWGELEEAIRAYRTTECPLIPVSVDIDVFKSLEEFSQDNPVTIRTKDRAGKMNLKLVQRFRGLAQRFGIPYSEDDRGYTLVETGMLSQQTTGQMTGAHIGIPLTNYHTDRETTTWAVIWNTIKLLTAIIADVGETPIP